MSMGTSEISEDTEQTDGVILDVSEQAIAKVLEIRSDEDDPTAMGLRVEITGTTVTSRGQDFTYDLSLEVIADAEPGDAVYIVGDDLTMIIPAASIDQLKGAVLDLPSNPIQGGLVIRNPNRPALDDDGGELVLEGTLAEKLTMLLARRINPSLAAHGGYAELVKMEDTVAHISMGGGCQGCSMSAATLRQGIEVMIADAIPEITEVVDATDHNSGINPYYS
jgi:Fe/S biogenesis protein NfuA